MPKPTEIQYPITDLPKWEQELADKAVSEINALIDSYGMTNVFSLPDVVKTLGAGKYVILHMKDDREGEPDVEAVIKANAPDSVIKHGVAIRQQDHGIQRFLKGDIKVPFGPDNVSREDLFLSKLALVIKENNEIGLLRGQPFPAGTRFTI